jgi:hypothetical protein
MKKLSILIVACGVAAASQAYVIDDFTTGSYNSGYISSGSVFGWTAAPGASGGIRGTLLNIQSNPLGNDARLRVQSSFGVFQVSAEPGVDAAVQAAYGFANNSTSVGSNALNLNFTSTPKIQLTVRSNDLALETDVYLITNNGASSYVRSMVIPGGITASSPQVMTFDFSSDAAMLGDVDAIVFDFDGAADGDYAFSNMQAVPEPASLAVLALGALVVTRRRK